jgi:hypothetical protein
VYTPGDNRSVHTGGPAAPHRWCFRSLDLKRQGSVENPFDPRTRKPCRLPSCFSATHRLAQAGPVTFIRFTR